MKNLNLNELLEVEISKRTQLLDEKLENKVTQVNELKKQLYSQDRKINKLEDKTKENKNSIKFIQQFRSAFKRLKEEKTDDYTTPLNRIRFDYISKLLFDFFSIKKEHKWVASYHDSASLNTLCLNLALNYYSNKEILIDIINILFDKENKEITKVINNFVMPYDYNKNELIALIKRIESHTNGSYNYISEFWLRGDAKFSNVPYNLVLQNKLTIEDEIFNILINSIESKISDFYYLYEVAKYQNLSDIQMQRLGETLISTSTSYYKYTEIEDFISTNLINFTDKTIEYFLTLATTDNQFRIFHWTKFPKKHQIGFLIKKSYTEISKFFNERSCNWTKEEQEDFYKLYFKNKS